MKLHPRAKAFAAGRLEIQEAVVTIASKYSFTDIECIQALLEVMSTHTKYALRLERHGDYEKKADEE